MVAVQVHGVRLAAVVARWSSGRRRPRSTMYIGTSGTRWPLIVHQQPGAAVEEAGAAADGVVEAPVGVVAGRTRSRRGGAVGEQVHAVLCWLGARRACAPPGRRAAPCRPGAEPHPHGDARSARRTRGRRGRRPAPARRAGDRIRPVEVASVDGENSVWRRRGPRRRSGPAVGVDRPAPVTASPGAAVPCFRPVRAIDGAQPVVGVHRRDARRHRRRGSAGVTTSTPNRPPRTCSCET